MFGIGHRIDLFEFYMQIFVFTNPFTISVFCKPLSVPEGFANMREKTPFIAVAVADGKMPVETCSSSIFTIFQKVQYHTIPYHSAMFLWGLFICVFGSCFCFPTDSPAMPVSNVNRRGRVQFCVNNNKTHL